MARWVMCEVCGYTGVLRDPTTGAERPCPGGCEGGRVYEDKNPEWFAELVKDGEEICEDESPPGSGQAPTPTK